MSLDDREQRILAEIERQFYEEDPDLAHAVRNIDRSARFGVRVPAVGLVVGAVIIVLAFTWSTFLALLGFVLMVVSATALVHAIRTRASAGRTTDGAQADLGAKFRRRFRRD